MLQFVFANLHLALCSGGSPRFTAQTSAAFWGLDTPLAAATQAG